MKKIFIVILFLLIACSFIVSCSEYDYSESDGNETGSIGFHVEWRGAPSLADEISGNMRKLVCQASDIETVTFEIVDINDSLLADDSWACIAGEGTVDEVPAGSDRKLIVKATDSQDRIPYRGESEPFDLTAGENKHVGTVTCEPVEIIEYAYLQYRTYADVNIPSQYRGWIDFTREGGPIDLFDIPQVSLKNASGNTVSVSEKTFYSYPYYNGEWKALTSSVEFSGPIYESGFSIKFPEGTSLPAGDYTYEATTSQETLITTTLSFPGETVLPTIDVDSMNHEWKSDNSLHLSWINPSGDYDELRVVVSDQDSDILYVSLPADVNDLIIPADIVQNITDLEHPSSAGWVVQTRSYDDNNNYARGISMFAYIPSWQPIPTNSMALIPSGCFDMGDAFAEGDGDELPVHNVCITSDFYMDVHEVTNLEYAACVSAGGCTAPSFSSSSTRGSYYGNSTYDDFPVIYVSWNQATDYCTWAGKRLPTEAEWEYAARGGLAGKRYPWGDTISGTDANYANSGDPWDNDTSPVENYAANGYGLYDMAGNVWEWVNDWYQSDYYSMSPPNDPAGPASGSSRVLRGGYFFTTTYALRVAYRLDSGPTYHTPEIGFRCAGG